MENIISKSTIKNDILNHRITIINRNSIEISGISKMLTSNDSLISMMIKNTKLNVLGKDLHIEKLDVENGLLQAKGTIDNVKYCGNDGFFKKVFKWK